MKEYRNILFCTDFSEDSNIAFLQALNLARRHGAKLHIIHIPHSPYTYSRHFVDEHIPESKAQYEDTPFDEEVANQAEKHLKDTYEAKLGDLKEYLFTVRCGSPDVEIIRYAKKNAVDLIVMGALGKYEEDRMIHGSTVASVSRYAHCHVMAVRNPAKRFILPVSMQ